jgi:tRNA(Arg) A34 adenosine deaminase TadA
MVEQGSNPKPTRASGAEIHQPVTPDERAFMQHAFEMRGIAIENGDEAIGAVVVQGNRIVGLGPSRVVTHRDPSAHAEIEAIRDACRRLDTLDLSGCVMYSTSRPCRMCETAAHWARISRLYYGAAIADGGSTTFDGC